MVRDAAGLTPDPHFLNTLQAWLGRYSPHIAVSVEAVDPLIDSADASHPRWYQIASCIHERHEEFASIIVLHGTDTLAYAGSALSFLLIGLSKPVVLTGAQLPWLSHGSDAQQNLSDALICSQSDELREVCIVFDRKVLRANRSTKTGTSVGDSFSSPHWPTLASLEPQLKIDHRALLSNRPSTLHSLPSAPSLKGVGLIKIYPGVGSDLILAAADAHPAGLVLELYGSGSAPLRDLSRARLFEKLASRKVALVATSQCLQGSIEDFCYASSSALADLGVIPGHDMTSEAAVTKMTYLNSLGLPYAELHSRIFNNVAGEVSGLGMISS